MWIEAKKRAAVMSKLKCVEDPRLRLDIGKVTDVVAKGREVAWGILYGSEPPPIDSVWQKIRERGWKVITTRRSTFTKKEKQVDHQMVADITALVSDRSVTKGKIVIVSGDADMIPAIKESLKMKWSTEIWMWEKGISKSLKNLADENPGLVNIITLDSRLEHVTFTNFKFGEKEIPKARSAIIKNIDFSPDEIWQKNLSKKLGWPFQFCMIGPEGLGNQVDFKDIILIFANVKAIDGKDFEKHFDKIFEDLKREYPEKVLNYPAYRREFDRKDEICIANRYDALHTLDEQLSSSSEDFTCNYGEIEELDGNDEKEHFQDVKGKQPKRSQKYSTLCKYRSNCHKGLKRECQYNHTEEEKKFFRQPCKDKECLYKLQGYCKNGPLRCHFAHSNEDSFCRNCHKWGHLQEKCTSEK